MTTNTLMTPSKMILFTLAAAATAMFTMTATADPGKGEGKGACRAEIQALCGDVERGEERRACMEASFDQLSAVCQEKVEKRKAKRKAAHAQIKAACQADAAALCGGLEGREQLQCMRKNRDNLSAQCSEAIAQHKGKKRGGGKAVRQACQADAAALCGGLEGREQRQCMRENRDNLSAQCTEAIAQHKGKKRGNR
ncbi:MAG: hypothetical protein AAFS10_26055 [Myxococcota bacterium]